MEKSKRANGEGKIVDHYDWTDGGKNDAEDGSCAMCIVHVGPIGGVISMADGTVYNVTPSQVAVKFEHLAELHHHIFVIHREAGRLDPGGIFEGSKHACTEACGPTAEL